MTTNHIISLGLLAVLAFLWACSNQPSNISASSDTDLSVQELSLPHPQPDSDTSVEQALASRRSVREYKKTPLNLADVSQLLWAAQGITDPSGKRTAPSAGALYPLEIKLLARDIEGLANGLYRYVPQGHSLVRIHHEEIREALADAALNQESLREAPAVIVLSAVYDRTTGKYGERGIKYVHMEVGFAAQNIYLQAESLDLGTVFIGAFYDEQVKEVLGLDDREQPLGLMPVGRK